MDKRKPLLEDIVQRITDLFQRNSAADAPPETDSAIETRQGGDELAIDKGSAFDWYNDETDLEDGRIGKYQEYDLMDVESVEIASALDIYADNATSGDRETNETIEIVSESEMVVEILNEVKGRMKLDFQMWSIAREMVKYGDCFEEVVVYPDMEVHRLKHLAPEMVKVVEDKWGRLDPDYPYEQTGESGGTEAKFAEWQILHFKMSKSRDSRYGVDGSLMYPLRKVFKQLQMIEDSMVIGRLTRAQQRFAFMIDVNGIEPGAPTNDYLKEVKNSMKKKRTIDPRTGKMDFKHNPLSVEEDLFLARRDGGGADVKVLQGDSNLGQLQDVEYFSKKLFAGLKVPKAWMGFEGDTKARAVITELDVQFARTERRVQQALTEGLRKLFDFILLTRGIDPKANPYKVKLPVLSTVDEMREWQMELIKVGVAKAYKDLGVNSEWVYRNLLDLTDEEIAEIRGSLDDEDGLDNVRAQKYMDMMTPPVEAQDGGLDKDGNPVTPDQAVGATLDKADKTGKADKAKVQVKKESLNKRELQMIRYQLGEELSSLYDLVDWSYEDKTGRNLGNRRRR